MVSALDFVFIVAFIVVAIIGARFGILNMVFIVASAYLIYLFGTLFASDTVQLIKNSFNAVSSIDESVLTFVTYVVFALLILAILGIAVRILRKLLKAFFLGWIDRTGGALIGVLAIFISVSIFSVTAAWIIFTGQTLLNLTEATLSVIGLDTPTAVMTATNWIDWLDGQISSSFIVRNITWPAWSVLDVFFPNRLFGIPLDQFTEAVNSLSSRP